MSAAIAWLNERRRGIGGSDVAAILGLSPHRSAWDVWTSKTDPSWEPEPERPEQRRGKLLEGAVLDWMADDAEMPRRRISQQVYQGPEEWAICTPDDLYATAAVWGLEAKTARRLDHWGPHRSPDGVPVYYALQAHWCMHCVEGAERWDVGVYFPMQDEWRRYTIERDPQVEDVLVERVGRWWQRHVVEGFHPAMDSSDTAKAWLTSRFRRPASDMREATPEEADAVRRHVQLKAQISELEDQRDRVGNQLRQAIGDLSGIHFPGGKATWKPTKTGRQLLTNAKE